MDQLPDHTPDPSLPATTATDLLAVIGTPSAPLVVDVRRAEPYGKDPHTIATSLRVVPEAVAEQARTWPRERPIVVFCVHGHKVSQAACRTLLDARLQASYLAGGMNGWLAARGPTMRKIAHAGGTASRWVTRERPKIDRIACPWLVRRFIDPRAEFLYVPGAEVRAVAARENATPYDIPDVQFSHRGERCSFDSFIEDFELRDPALDIVAKIVRGADTGEPDLTPQSSGLLAFSLGLSRLYPDDHAMLAEGLKLYDALFAWARDAQTEVHNADLFQKK